MSAKVHKLALALITADRTPKANYLGRTLSNLVRGGVFVSPHLNSFTIADTGKGDRWPDGALNLHGWYEVKPDHASMRHQDIHKSVRRISAVVSGSAAGGAMEPLPGPTSHNVAPFTAAFAPAPGAYGPVVYVHRCPLPRPSHVNAAVALEGAAAMGAEWILFMEDDIDVCGDFLESVVAWLNVYATPEVRIYPMGAPYEAIRLRANMRQFTWEYPVPLFYGSQCFAIRTEDAASLAAYWYSPPTKWNPTAIDLMVGGWHEQAYPSQPHFLTPAPSFIQHIGRESIATAKVQTHQFETWPGPFWVFEPGVVRV